jgi:hypothetical protein
VAPVKPREYFITITLLSAFALKINAPPDRLVRVHEYLAAPDTPAPILYQAVSEPDVPLILEQTFSNPFIAEGAEGATVVIERDLAELIFPQRPSDLTESVPETKPGRYLSSIQELSDAALWILVLVGMVQR